jgi:DNA-binding NarL/FixJ family response regulator
MAKINQQLILRMVENGYSDEAIAQRLRYDVIIVKTVREKAQTINSKLKMDDDKNTFNR